MKTTFAFILLLQSFFYFGQNIQISGTVTSEKTNIKLASAKVSVFNAADNSLKESTTTDESGKYKIEVKESEFYIKINLSGYKNLQSKLLKKSNGNQTQNFVLQEDVSDIEEVVVMKTNKILTLKGDKMIFDVDKSGFGNGNDALETLTKLPGARLDKDENVVFRGNPNVQIMID